MPPRSLFPAIVHPRAPDDLPGDDDDDDDVFDVDDEVADPPDEDDRSDRADKDERDDDDLHPPHPGDDVAAPGDERGDDNLHPPRATEEGVPGPSKPGRQRRTRRVAPRARIRPIGVWARRS